MKLQPLPCYCATLRQAARAATVFYEQVLSDTGIRPTQFTVLQALDVAPNLTTTDLADAIGIDQTTATRALSLLRQNRLAKNTVGKDRRERRWTLTADGETTLRRLMPKWEAAQASFEKQIGRDAALNIRRSAYRVAHTLATE
ncbi:MAG: MarR family winged helix-turn-helix transcriptional regulator [bacterium]